jgi:2,4-dienoyl-CoA reductase-like NADH-dependent reductase (Old Yellow Enzyme family)/thioredoxin reductase
VNYETLFSPFSIRHITFKNRIFSTGHMTRMTQDGLPTEQMLAYHEARARGGAGLIICEAARVHDSALSDSPAIDASTDRCIAPYTRMAQAVHHYGCKMFGQVSHSGRANDRRRGGLRDVPYSASATPDERFHNVPRQMSGEMIAEVVSAYGSAAKRLIVATLDGIEIPVSHGLLPAQFLNPRVNCRSDEYGGNLENRCRFVAEVIRCVRRVIGDESILGIRFSIDELEHGGLEKQESLALCEFLSKMPELDYFNVIAGSMAGLSGSVHVVPPMMIEHAYTAPLAHSLKEITDKPVFVAGRINHPQLAENILNSAQADMCGMTRALISDSQMPNKVHAGKVESVRLCIGCNQACIGHYHLGTSISCIQNPASGREQQLGRVRLVSKTKQILVVGAGPAGLKAAATAAERGHKVMLAEKSSKPGGQVNLAQMLPGRSEFGGLTENLLREAQEAGVDFQFNTEVNEAFVSQNNADSIILATGAIPNVPEIPGAETSQIVTAWEVLRGEVKVGSNVLVADWGADWVGLGLAELLTRNGSSVQLAVNGMMAGYNLQSYVRDQWLGTVFQLGVEIIPYSRLFGVDESTVYLQHTLNNEPVICENVDTVVLALGHKAEASLEEYARRSKIAFHMIGDCLSPRTAEEAVYEGMKIARAV